MARSGGCRVEWRCPFCIWALVALRKLLSLLPAHLNRVTPTAPGRSFWNNDVNCLPAFVSFTLALPLSSACYPVLCLLPCPLFQPSLSVFIQRADPISIRSDTKWITVQAPNSADGPLCSVHWKKRCPARRTCQY